MQLATGNLSKMMGNRYFCSSHLWISVCYDVHARAHDNGEPVGPHECRRHCTLEIMLRPDNQRHNCLKNIFNMVFSAHHPNINQHHAVVDNVIVVHHDPIEPPLMAAAAPSGLPVGFSS
jgi:hypothetical protein